MVSLQQRIDGVIDDAVEGRRIVGTVVIVAREGEIVYRRAAGVADRTADTPAIESTLFRLASLSKPVTATAALAAMDRGLLSLDDDIAAWLPDFRPALPDGTVPTITIRHLITHTSGLTYRFAQWPGGSYHIANVSDGLEQPGLSMAENLRRMVAAGLMFAPGTAWGYSLGIDVLGEILARLHGKDLEAVLGDYVFAPLGMVDTAFTPRDPARLSKAYADSSPEPVEMEATHAVPRPTEPPVYYSPARALDPASFQSGGAGLVGTAGDFLLFLESIRTGSLLAPETHAAAISNQIGTLAGDCGGPGWRFGYLSGIIEDPIAANTPQSPMTLQWGGAHGNVWFVDRAARLSVVSLTNTAVEGVDGAFPRALRDAIYGA